MKEQIVNRVDLRRIIDEAKSDQAQAAALLKIAQRRGDEVLIAQARLALFRHRSGREEVAVVHDAGAPVILLAGAVMRRDPDGLEVVCLDGTVRRGPISSSGVCFTVAADHRR